MSLVITLQSGIDGHQEESSRVDDWTVTISLVLDYLTSDWIFEIWQVKFPSEQNENWNIQRNSWRTASFGTNWKENSLYFDHFSRLNDCHLPTNSFNPSVYWIFRPTLLPLLWINRPPIDVPFLNPFNCSTIHTVPINSHSHHKGSEINQMWKCLSLKWKTNSNWWLECLQSITMAWDKSWPQPVCSTRNGKSTI